MANVIWVGTIEISYLDHEDSDKRKNAFTVVNMYRGRIVKAVVEKTHGVRLQVSFGDETALIFICGR